MKQLDVLVIGGGLLGCFAARALCRWQLSVGLAEAANDVCTGISRANSAIVYAGYDNKPGSKKAQMTVRGNARMEDLCRELDVPFSRCGSLLVSCSRETNGFLEKKLRNGTENGVPGLQLLSGEEARQLEPMLTEQVQAALYAPSTGTVNPWQLGIAAYENALHNGCEVFLNTAVLDITKDQSGYVVQTNLEPIRCRAIVNCTGCVADRVQELLFPPSIRLRLDAADYLVLDPRAKKPGCIIFHQAQVCGKGITAIPCTEGNLLLSGTRRPMEVPFSTTKEGLDTLRASTAALLPELDLNTVIRSFGAVRPNPYRVGDEDRSLGDFCIETPAPDFISFIGIKTPGLTCAAELGRHAAEQLAANLHAEPNHNFDPNRKSIVRFRDLPPNEQAALAAKDPGYGEIVCQCEQVTNAEIREAIARGAVTVDGIKRRTGCGMGRCQGSRCRQKMEELLCTQAEPLRRGIL